MALQELYNNGRIDIKSTTDDYLISLVPEEFYQKTIGWSVQERLVFKHIEKSGNNGISTKSLLYPTGIDIKQIRAAIKGLKEKKQVKSKKVENNLLLFTTNAKPEKFPQEYTDIVLLAKPLTDHALQVILEHKSLSLAELFTILKRSGKYDSFPSFDAEFVKRVVETLKYDRLVQERDKFYQPVDLHFSYQSDVCMRCVRLPICSDRQDDLTPKECPLLAEWLDQSIEDVEDVIRREKLNEKRPMSTAEVILDAPPRSILYAYEQLESDIILDF